MERKASKKRRTGDETVVTPGGPRSKARVHRVGPGQSVSGRGGRLLIVEKATGKVMKDLGEAAKADRSSGAPKKTKQ